MELKNQSDGTNNRFGRRKNGRYKGIDPEYKDADMDYEVTRADIKILKQIHSLDDTQYKRLMAYMKALQKLEQMESMVEE